MAIKKQDYIDALTAKGVTLKGDEKVEDLKALADEHGVQFASADAVTVKYRDHRGEPTERTFSKEVHGDNFADLADEFKATNAKACEGLN